MYGSFPEMTISMRYLKAKMERIRTFITSPPPKKWPVTYEQMLAIAGRIRNEPRARIQLPGQQHRLTLAVGTEQETANSPEPCREDSLRSAVHQFLWPACGCACNCGNQCTRGRAPGRLAQHAGD